VVDPVMVAKGGARLLRNDAIAALMTRLLPLAAVITPNLPEAEVLLGRSLRTLDDRRQAARDLVGLGPRAAVLKGGHSDRDATDFYFDGHDLVELPGRRIQTRNTHGSGCTFSAAIAAGLARRQPLADAAREAKAYVTAAIREGFRPGRGVGALRHFVASW